MTTVKQRAWRKKFTQMVRSGKFKGGRGRTSVKTKVVRVYKMARKKYRRGRRAARGLLGGGLIKAALIGAAVGYTNIGSQVPVVNGTPYANALTAAGASYITGGKSVKNMAIAGIVAQFLPQLLGKTATTTSTSFVSGY